MTLRGKILAKMGALLGCFALLGVLAVWGFAGLRTNNATAQCEFHEMQEIRYIGVQLAEDKALLGADDAGRAQIVSHLRATASLNRFIVEQVKEQEDNDSQLAQTHDELEKKYAEKAIFNVQEMLSVLDSKEAGEPLAQERLRQLHHETLLALDGVAGECSRFLSLVHEASRTRVKVALIGMSVLSLAMLAAATTVGVSVYRSIVLPLRQLSDGVGKIAAGQFAQRLPEQGDPEFVAVIEEFNRMAGQLEEFYLRLEDKVAQKSRELVRSERLASVGFLAAGVAHEIRNPLGIISGYAELSLKALNNAEQTASSIKERRILKVIRDEAFRCKQITDKLLGLIQGNGETKQPVDLGRVVRDVHFLVRGLQSFHDRQPSLNVYLPESLYVLANPIEMKQVVLNLTLNALEAVESGAGRIDVEGRRIEGRIELQVRDNGCGMTRETLGHVFEPFFTSKRGRAAPGTGLGLSISYAIVEGFGGKLRAESDGPGLGSRFIIELPASQESMA